MKSMRMMAMAAAAVALLALAACDKKGKGEGEAVDSEKLGYALGLEIGNSLKQIGADEGSIDLDAMGKGIADQLKGEKPEMNDEEIAKVKTAFFNQMREKQIARIKAEGEGNLKKGEAFLAENGKKEGVVTTASGLQYKVVKEGNGKRPNINSQVSVHYRGRLLDGSEFDSSYSRNQPANFPLKGVIPGWSEGVQLMKEGGKYELYVPAKLAYGENGAPPKIGPNSTLIFEVELLSVK